MANPAENPVSFINQALLNPDSPAIEASPAALRVLEDELQRIADIQSKLFRARANVARRLST